uniref:Transmembrane protein n=1 Tax=Arundo donax TaxID=35708 RepID=A0A0A9AHS7_ARUDO
MIVKEEWGGYGLVGALCWLVKHVLFFWFAVTTIVKTLKFCCGTGDFDASCPRIFP